LTRHLVTLDDTDIVQWDLFWERQRSRSVVTDRFADAYDWAAREHRDPTPRVDAAPLGRDPAAE
jgi:hypothetical protein